MYSHILLQVKFLESFNSKYQFVIQSEAKNLGYIQVVLPRFFAYGSTTRLRCDAPPNDICFAYEKIVFICLIGGCEQYPESPAARSAAGFFVVE